MLHAETAAILQSLQGLLVDGRTGTLLLLLCAAAIVDCRTHRIPNLLVLTGAVFGVAYNTLYPLFPQYTIVFPLAGLALGLCLFLPLYALKAMGAGDVKLMAMVGAFLGPLATLKAAICTVIAGGVLAILYVVARGTALRMWHNLAAQIQASALGAAAGSPHVPHISAAGSAGRLPYAVAIAAGTFAFLVMHRLGFL